MRNTLRLLGIIALVALIGFGLMACNDGSTTTEEKPEMLYPIEDDFNYGDFWVAGNGSPQGLSITPKAGKSNGPIIILYNGNDEKPSAIGEYLVTFNVGPSSDLKYGSAKGLVAGTFTIGEADRPLIIPDENDFDYIGRGSYKYNDADPEPRGIIPVPHYEGAKVTNVRYFNVINDIEMDLNPVNYGVYGVKFNVSGGSGYQARTDIVKRDILEIWEGKPPVSGEVEEDFIISGRSQLYVQPTDYSNLTRRALSVVPKIHASKGAQTFWYQSDDVESFYIRSNLMPWEKGTYNVTMDIAPDGDFKAMKNIDMGELTIADKVTPSSAKIDLKLLDHFDIEAPTADNWGGSYNWDGGQKGIYIQPKKGVKTGIAQVYFALKNDLSGVPDYINASTAYPTDAGAYQVYVTIDDSAVHDAITSENTLALGTPLVIVPIVPEEKDFSVALSELRLSEIDGVDHVQNILTDRFISIGKDVPISTQTFKEVHYPVVLYYKGNPIDYKWTNVYYNGVRIPISNTPGDPDYIRDWGPVNAGTYKVTFSLNPSNNFLTVGGINNVADVGTIEIKKADPQKYHYELTASTQTFGSVTLPSVRKVAAANSGIQDGFVSSDAAMTDLRFNGLPVTRTGAVVTYPVDANVYALTMVLKETDNWLGKTIDLADEWEIENADLADASFTISDTDYHVQSAYYVKGIKDVVRVVAAQSSKIASWEVWYGTKIFDDTLTPAGAPSATWYQGFTTPPQQEGEYYVRIVATGAKNYNDRKFPAIRNGFVQRPDQPTLPGEFAEYGLVVNPLIIREMNDFEEWLSLVTPNYIPTPAPGFEDISLFDVAFVLNDEFNTPTYNPNAKKDIDHYTLVELLKANPGIPVHLNFFYNEDNDFVTTFEDYEFDATADGVGAFEGCTSIKKVTFASEGTGVVLGENAFKDCTGLTEVPSGVSYIGDYAFQGATGIRELVINAETRPVSFIGVGAFAGLTGLTSVVLADVSYAAGAWSGDGSSTLVTIDSNAFNGCTGITEIYIPSSVETIGEAAFLGCSNLIKVSMPEYTEELLGTDPSVDIFEGDLEAKYALPLTGGAGTYSKLSPVTWSNQNAPISF
jgi:hypothetical protein